MRFGQPTRRPAAARKPLPPPTVRYEPPTIEEAVAAARDLSSDPEIQVELAASLMGASPDDVRPFVNRPTRLSLSNSTVTVMTGRRTGARTVTVERVRPRRVMR